MKESAELAPCCDGQTTRPVLPERRERRTRSDWQSTRGGQPTEPSESRARWTTPSRLHIDIE